MKVSVVTVCYNAADEIRPTLESVAGQTYQNIEYIVIDGASTDATMEIVGEFSHCLSIVKSEKDAGIYDAMNKALGLFTGDCVIFMNAGDYFYSNRAIELAVDFMALNPAVGVVYGGLEVRFENGSKTLFDPPHQDSALEFLVEGSLPHQATFARRMAFSKTGLFNTNYKSHADYDWFLRVASDPAIGLARMPFTVASFGLGGASSNLERGERERHVVQNSTPIYQSQTWLKRRVEIYQEIYLRQRLELQRLA
jgi:glycosyltransferase involved in cell wall biosynthesis